MKASSQRPLVDALRFRPEVMLCKLAVSSADDASERGFWYVLAAQMDPIDVILFFEVS